jgi:hypothetical protein
MTVDDLITQPNSQTGAPFQEDSLPDIALEWAGRNLTRRETYCLLTHIYLADHRNLLPEAWHDPLGLALMEVEERGGSRWSALPAIARIAGPRTLNAVRDRLRSGRMNEMVLFHLLGPLLAQDWLLSLPLFAQALSGSGTLQSYFKGQIEARLEEFRVRQGIAVETWELLMIPESEFSAERLAAARVKWAGKLEEFMRRGVRFGGRDFRLLAEHPVHGENLRGLLLMWHTDGPIDNRSAGCQPAPQTWVWPFAVGDADEVSIAHPLFLDPREREAWAARIEGEGRVPPFDQWTGAGKRAELDLNGIGANPADLMLHLEARGWHRGRPGADGVIRSHSKLFSDLSQRAVIEYSGIPTKYGGRWSFQTVTGCRFECEKSDVASPIAVSVVIDDLEGLRR